jgi:aldehyde reductase
MDEIPRIGLGTLLATDEATLEADLVYAIEECGYRHIDTAQVYMNESIIGATLQKSLAKGVIKQSKLWSTEHRPERVQPALLASLARPQLDHVDLYLMHQAA